VKRARFIFFNQAVNCLKIIFKDLFSVGDFVEVFIAEIVAVGIGILQIGCQKKNFQTRFCGFGSPHLRCILVFPLERQIFYLPPD